MEGIVISCAECGDGIGVVLEEDLANRVKDSIFCPACAENPEPDEEDDEEDDEVKGEVEGREEEKV